MNIYTLNKKGIVGDKLNMSSPTLLFLEMEPRPEMSVHEVTADEIGRIDLVSISEYGGADYVDYILKFNGISNPFSITEGDKLIIPPLDGGKKKFKLSIESSEKNPIRDQFINTKRLPVKDANRIKYLSKKYNKEILPPNILRTGETNITVTNGEIRI